MGESPVTVTAPFARDASDPVISDGLQVTERLRNAGHTAFFAGGFARDRLIGRPIHDIDIATSARPEQVLSLFPGSRSFGKAFGVIQVDGGDHEFEVATFREDSAYTDGRHPDSIIYATPVEDARRRDFTVNGLFYNPERHELIDHVGGLPDIAARTIRAIGDPSGRFREDHLRIMRAVRFAAVLDFNIEPVTWNAMRACVDKLAAISPERLRVELMRTLMEAPSPGRALDLLRDAGILAVILPEVMRLIGVEQPPEFHPEGDVYTHTRMMLDEMRERSPELVWAILMHDIAKPDTFEIGTDREGKPRIRFQGHAEMGAEMAVAIMRRFRCSNDEIEAVQTAVKNHMKFIAVPEMRSSTLRRWVGSATFPLELELHRIDCTASHGKLDHHEQIRAFQEAMMSEPVLPPPLVSGRDLIALGMKPGPRMGEALKRLYDAQLEGAFHTREEGVAWARSRSDVLSDIDKG